MRFFPILALMALGLLGAAGVVADGQSNAAVKRANGGRYTPSMDSYCVRGRYTSAECEAIRAREIVDASTRPWSALGRVNHAKHRHRFHCSGTLVSDRIVITAAHCLYDRILGKWADPSEVFFVAGYQQQAYVAASSAERFVLDPIHDVNVPEFIGGPENDWALLILKEPIGGQAGFARLSTNDPDDPAHPAVRSAGYAGLRPYVLSATEACKRFGSVRNRLLVYGCATMQGDSGAPLFFETDEGLFVTGLISALRVRNGHAQTLVVPASSFAETVKKEQAAGN